MTAAQIALASLDAFVILTGSGVISNLLAGWLARWWTRRDYDRRDELVMHPFVTRCEHLGLRESCDYCNTNPKGA
jgi:hypothetical protein